MKKLFTFIFTFLFSVGLAFGQQNNAQTRQRGSRNSVLIHQVYQGGAATASNEAQITQTGDNNRILRLAQRGAGNQYAILQKGNFNTIKKQFRQGHINSASYHGVIRIKQVGDYNSVIGAGQAGIGNKLTFMQKGDRNVANVKAQVSTGSDGNILSLIQNGNRNQAGTANNAGLFQQGTSNRIKIKQAGSDNVVGSLNISPDATAVYGTPNSHYVTSGKQGIVQLGVNNTLVIKQNGQANVVSSVIQQGEGNRGRIIQKGAGRNAAAIHQIGNLNRALIKQRGTQNSATIIQN